MVAEKAASQDLAGIGESFLSAVCHVGGVAAGCRPQQGEGGGRGGGGGTGVNPPPGEIPKNSWEFRGLLAKQIQSNSLANFSRFYNAHLAGWTCGHRGTHAPLPDTLSQKDP